MHNVIPLFPQPPVPDLSLHPDTLALIIGTFSYDPSAAISTMLQSGRGGFLDKTRFPP